VNLLDVVLIALIVLAAINGFRRGAALQIIAYAGLLLGLFVGALVAPPLARLAETPNSQAFIALATLIALAAIGDAIGWVLGTKVWVLARRSVLGAVDSGLGSLVGVTAVLLATWFVAFNLANGPSPELSRQLRGSAIVRGLDEALPRPPSLIAEVRQFFDRFGFPEVFADLPPAPAGPVEEPTQGEAAAAARKADQSTFRIVGRGCGAIQEGSGFMAADNLVVTNAHVVAGVGSPEVQEQNGGSHPADTVLFNPQLDIAILRIDSTPAPPLSLDPDEEERGAKGAVLGYPGGGNLDIEGAAVRRQLAATGRDIYGRSIVTRDVYELQSLVRPGNSGGPFVLQDGTVAGVVFAASTTEGDLAYAITSSEVIPLLDRAKNRTNEVSTDGCTR
jgi:S1-C subfamily serine protease